MQAAGVLRADEIDLYLRSRLKQRVRCETLKGFVELGQIQKKLLSANPRRSVVFPIRVKGLFRPHYMTWSEQRQVEFHAPVYLANAVRIITETGFRVLQRADHHAQGPYRSVKQDGLNFRFQDSKWSRRGAVDR